MLFDDTYKTISGPAEGVFTDRGSKFIGYVFPLNNEEDIRTILADIHIKHPKARHHCWAYRLTPDRSVFRINDDGEPSGSAGRPILNTLLSHDLTNVIAIVVRYFGGTLLGVPGLIKAYKTATTEALSAAMIVEKAVFDIYEVKFTYINMNEIMKVIKNENLMVKKQEFDNHCLLEVAIRKSKVTQAIDKLNKISDTSLVYLYSN